jgi:hypothetical protein
MLSLSMRIQAVLAAEAPEVLGRLTFDTESDALRERGA